MAMQTQSKSPLGKSATVFIDGEAGTTGLEIRERLAGWPISTCSHIDPAKRKEPAIRQALMNAADVDLACFACRTTRRRRRSSLPTRSGRMVQIIDASTAHRVDPNWVYGFPR